MFSICVNKSGRSGRANGKGLPSPIAGIANVVDVWRRTADMLAARGLIDRERVGIAGLSMSSQAVQYALFTDASFAAASIGAPSLPDPIWAWLLPDDRWQSVRGRYDLPQRTDEDQSKWQVVSPAVNAAKIRAPVLVNAADVEARPGAQFFASLRERSVPLEVNIFPDEDHQIFAYPKHTKVIYDKNVAWFSYWLKSTDASRWVSRDQRRVWDELQRQWSARQ